LAVLADQQLLLVADALSVLSKRLHAPIIVNVGLARGVLLRGWQALQDPVPRQLVVFAAALRFIVLRAWRVLALGRELAARVGALEVLLVALDADPLPIDDVLDDGVLPVRSLEVLDFLVVRILDLGVDAGARLRRTELLVGARVDVRRLDIAADDVDGVLFLADVLLRRRLVDFFYIRQSYNRLVFTSLLLDSLRLLAVRVCS
jgi:hypothetical protein